MANAIGSGITVQRTSATEWTVYYGNGLSEAFTTRKAAHSFAFGLVSEAAQAQRTGKTGAARGEVQVITLTSYAGTDSFAIRHPENNTETVAFVRGTNGTAAAIQTALRTLMDDASLTVTGTTDEGPFTVTWVADLTQQALLRQGTVADCTLAVTRTTSGGVGV